ncbi:6-hydroxypseudooxynicotine dehydrogenase complex subunit alpha [bacterium HR29]|jgi:CO/xanthine dehydrogenase FAD-binding subunit|nr:6-hydroxypseudooxynicotine dehydrogenase complex subunit alpha [bacterium HR29]
MRAFDYAAPRSLDETFPLLADGRRVRFLAGGTDIIVQLREGRAECDLLVDLKRIPELRRIEIRPDGTLAIGAAVPCAEVYEHPEVRRRWPALVDAASLIGGIQIQSRASLGGNICNASPAADSVPALIVLGARLVLASARGERELPIEGFFRGPGQTVLQPGELLVRIEVPPLPPCSGARFLRFIPRNEMDIAVANAAAFLRLDDDGRIAQARVALGAVAPTPLLVAEAGELLAGQQPNDELFARAGELAAAAARPITDVRGSVLQRRHLARVLTVRALRGALARAQEGS